LHQEVRFGPFMSSIAKNHFLLKTQLRNFASRGWVWPIYVFDCKKPFFVAQLRNFASRGWVWPIHVLNCKKPVFVEDPIEEFCIKRLGLAHLFMSSIAKNHFLLKTQLRNFASRGWAWPIHFLNCNKTQLRNYASKGRLWPIWFLDCEQHCFVLRPNWTSKGLSLLVFFNNGKMFFNFLLGSSNKDKPILQWYY